MKRMLIFSTVVFLLIFSLPIINGSGQTQEGKSGLVTLDFEDADIRDVIRVIALASDVNMVIGQDVQAKVTISLSDVPWERALDVILRTYNFTYRKENNLIRIMTFEKVKQEERDIPLDTKIVYLNFAEVADMQATLAKVLSDRGSIETDTRTNSMLITDVPDKLEEAEKIAKRLDTRTPQVLIEAMLVDVKLTKDDELGINWDIVHVDRNKAWRDKTVSSAKTNNYNYVEQPSSPMSSLTSTSIEFGWLEKLGAFRIEGLIKAWVQDQKANILASPKIVTLDNQTAKIEIKSQAPYTQTTSSDQGGSTTSTQFKDVITGLEVTPHITKEGFISMNVKPKQEFIEAYIGATNEPQIGSRTAETNVLVKDGETIVIGGLRKVEDTVTITKVPLLGDIPYLGNLFRKKDVQKINTELVMFVTPHIIGHPELTEEEKDRYKMLEQERERFLKEWEKEKQLRLKKSKKQARLSQSEISENLAWPEQDLTEEMEIPVLPAEQRLEEELEEDTDYIYSW